MGAWFKDGYVGEWFGMRTFLLIVKGIVSLALAAYAAMVLWGAFHALDVASSAHSYSAAQAEAVSRG